MKTTIVIEDGRVTVQVDDEQAVVVKPVDKGGVQIEPPLAKSKPEHKIAQSSTDLSNPLPTDDRKCEECGGPMTGRPPIAKICARPECKKSRAKKQNEEMRRRRGQNVGVGRGRGRRAQKPADDWGHGNDETPMLTQTAPAQDPEYLSKCHDAKVRVGGGEDEPDEGGTRYYVCLACENACDVYPKPFDDPWNCGACRGHGRLCGLHFNIERDGKLPPVFVHQS